MSISTDSFSPELLDKLSQHCNGCDFEQAPTEWQRFVESMVRKGVKFEF